MSIVRWNPARELLNIEREFNKLFNAFGKRFGVSDSGADSEYENAVWMPLTDIKEDKDNYFVMLDLPGVSKEDVKVSYADGQLSISGERKQEKETKDSKYHRVERAYGKYYRSFTLPQQVKEDKIEAEFKDGQLTVTVPKAEEAKPKELEIKIK
ncbi:MAG: Hsp20/alpha crystallin family protein [Ignavibacteriaceae bacterium]|nr:Hsp20/alpha crystallin family protein [Ignavibacteriaceae bacterium]